MDGGDQRTNNENAKLRIYATIRRTSVPNTTKLQTQNRPSNLFKYKHIRIQFSFILLFRLFVSFVTHFGILFLILSYTKKETMAHSREKEIKVFMQGQSQ
jgi:hypothetical protein